MEIPPEVIVEILAYLPVRPLFRFKSVSKLFLYLITSDSLLARLHIARSLRFRDASFSLFVSFYNKSTSHLYFVSAPQNGGVANRLFALPNCPSEPTEAEHLNGLVLFGSKNGYVRHDFVNVVNPTTRNVFRLPGKVAGPRYSIGNAHICNMFGFDELNGEYKILSIRLININRTPTKIDFAIFSLSSYSWRNIDLKFPYTLRSGNWIDGSKSSVCVNSVIYFMALLEGVIYGFDLREEKLSTIPLHKETCPSYYVSYIKEKPKSNFPYLVKLNGHLGLICHEHVVEHNIMDVWILKDHDNRIWMKHIIEFPAPWLSMGTIYPCDATPSGELMFTPLKSSSEVVKLPLYDMKGGSFRFNEVILVDKCLSSDDVEVGHARSYVESIVPLRKNERRSRLQT